MSELRELLNEFRAVAADPAGRARAAAAAGKKLVGVMPYFCPEELVYAAGLLPFGLWGGELQASESKRYYPAFICSILHTALELGIRGDLDVLSAVMIPNSCDSLKGMAANWKYGVGEKIPVVSVSYAQNRRLPAGEEFTVSQFRKILRELEAVTGRAVTDEDVRAAIKVYDQNRASLLRSTVLMGKHPELVSPADRCAVLKSRYFMDRAEHTALAEKLCALLEAAPEQPWKGLKMVTTGILADAPALLQILEENGIAVIADQVAHESVDLREPTPVTEDPLLGMAQRLGKLEGCSVLFDPGKERGRQLVRLAQETGADGVLWIMTKFCDPEEFDFVPVKRMLDKAGIPVLSVDTDRQMVNYEQARSAVQAFAEILK